MRKAAVFRRVLEVLPEVINYTGAENGFGRSNLLNEYISSRAHDELGGAYLYLGARIEQNSLGPSNRGRWDVAPASNPYSQLSFSEW